MWYHFQEHGFGPVLPYPDWRQPISAVATSMVEKLMTRQSATQMRPPPILDAAADVTVESEAPPSIVPPPVVSVEAREAVCRELNEKHEEMQKFKAAHPTRVIELDMAADGTLEVTLDEPDTAELDMPPDIGSVTVESEAPPSLATSPADHDEAPVEVESITQ